MDFSSSLCKLEKQQLSLLRFISCIHHSLTSVFLQVPGVTDIGLKPRNVKKAAVIGGGLMGSGIATALLLGNIRVILKEINSEYLLKGIKTIEGDYSIPVM